VDVYDAERIEIEQNEPQEPQEQPSSWTTPSEWNPVAIIDQPDGYVYDIYQLNPDLTNRTTSSKFYIDSDVEIDIDDFGYDDSDSQQDDYDEDSNSEGWVGNDYPDEEDDEVDSFDSDY